MKCILGFYPEVLHSFSVVKGKFCLVIATTAFGMGVNCQDITQVIHWKVSATIEEHIQEADTYKEWEPAVAVLRTYM